MKIIGARKTFFVPLEITLALDFIKDNHSQGIARTGKRPKAFGLVFEGDLIAVAIFSSPRTAKARREYSTELFRMAFKRGVRVPGGASKLIKNYIQLENPVDFFTYQDLSGQAGSVYEKSGMSLVSIRPVTEVLVANGLSYSEARNNRRDWISLEQASSKGPDALLGTNLGEVYREDGSRKSNISLFVEHCGYHRETIPGYRIYEWKNPGKLFYTYKITSVVDDFYYLGRHFGPKNVSPETDGYMGSGGRAFQEWVLKVGKANLRKEILGIQSSWRENLLEEHKIIGDLYKTDPNCLNSLGGFTGTLAFAPLYSIKLCPIHGESKHNGDSCSKCVASKTLNYRVCSIHGKTSHLGSSCAKCVALSAIKVRNCPLHGNVNHQGSICSHCNSKGIVSYRECSTHGRTKFQGDTCSKCSYAKTLQLKNCSIHGVSKTRGGKCLKCQAALHMTTLECPSHGKSIHKGERCVKCLNESTQKGKISFCEKHGLRSFKGDSCYICEADRRNTQKYCELHGLTPHSGNTCMKCSIGNSFYLSNCKVHGEVKFRGGQCLSCKVKKDEIRDCVVHGPSNHRGDKCRKCSAAKSYGVKECEIHGKTLHRGKRCMECSRERQLKTLANKKLLR